MTYNDLTEKVHSNAVKHGFGMKKKQRTLFDACDYRNRRNGGS